MVLLTCRSGLGWICLRTVPRSAPLPLQPEKYEIPKEYVRRMLNGAIKDYCRVHDRLPMYSHFETMARELRVISQPVPESDRYNVSRRVFLSRWGYGPIERI